MSVGDLARVGHAEFDFEPLADTWYSKVGQHGKVRLGFKVCGCMWVLLVLQWLLLLQLFCC